MKLLGIVGSHIGEVIHSALSKFSLTDNSTFRNLTRTLSKLQCKRDEIDELIRPKAC